MQNKLAEFNPEDYVRIEIQYNQNILLSTKLATELMLILSQGSCLSDEWHDDTIKITPHVSYTVNSISTLKINQIKKAQLAGISYKAYRELLEKEKENETNEGSEPS